MSKKQSKKNRHKDTPNYRAVDTKTRTTMHFVGKSVWTFMFASGILGSILIMCVTYYYQNYYMPITVHPSEFNISSINRTATIDIYNRSGLSYYSILSKVAFDKPSFKLGDINIISANMNNSLTASWGKVTLNIETQLLAKTNELGEVKWIKIILDHLSPGNSKSYIIQLSPNVSDRTQISSKIGLKVVSFQNKSLLSIGGSESVAMRDFVSNDKKNFVAPDNWTLLKTPISLLFDPDDEDGQNVYIRLINQSSD